MTKKIFAFVTLATLIWSNIKAQSFYDLNTIQKIEIHFTQSNWDYQMDTAKNGAEGYIIAQWAKVNGIQYDSVGVKYKGNSSYNQNSLKNPVHIALDEVIGNQAYQGCSDIKLANGTFDPSMIREALAYQILENYMDCPKANYAQLYINGSLTGLYTNDESISKNFCSQHYYSSNGTFIKCNPQTAGGPGSGKSNLKYINNDSSQYFPHYEIKSTYGWSDLLKLCDSVTNNAASLHNVMDVDKVIWMLAFNILTVNLDSYSGSFVQNYYLYKDNTGHYNPTIWDLNMCFAGFTNTGTGAPLNSNTLKQQLTTTLHISDATWPLIMDVLNNPMYRKMYFAHMRTMNSEMFTSGLYQTMASNIQSIIDTAVQSDIHKFYTYANFQNGMTQDVPGGFGGSIIAIGNLMQGRSAWLANTTDFQYVQPDITNVIANPAAPTIGSSVSFNATVINTNTTSVYLGYRYAISDKFIRVLMYDDGSHNDGAAGDNLYGVDLPMSSAQMQYYVYAENNNAGKFSPVRAEYEFYTLNAQVTTVNAGSIVVNEFLAINQNDTIDGQSTHEDWIELFNNTSQTISLAGVYLTDDFNTPLKWQFPSSAFIPANGYVFVWADQDNSAVGYHTNFKLSGSGESIMLGYANGLVLDSVSFGMQYADVSSARCPDGTGTFNFVNLTTPNYSNSCFTGLSETTGNQAQLIIYPNPASSQFYVLQNGEEGTFNLFDTNGKLMLSENLKDDKTISVHNLVNGIYFYQYVRNGSSDIKSGKISVQK